MLILNNTLSIKKISKSIYKDFQLLYAFGSGGGAISLNNNKKNDKYIISEHFAHEIFDYVSFSDDKTLKHIKVAVSGENKKFPINKVRCNNNSNYLCIELKNNTFIGFECMRFREFNHIGRYLIIHDIDYIKDENIEIEIFFLTKDLGICLSKCQVVGYILNEPLSYLTLNFTNMNIYNEICDEDYMIFSKWFDIISDNNLEYYDDDMELLLNDNYLDLLNYSNNIRNTKIKEICKYSLEDLMNFYAR